MKKLYTILSVILLLCNFTGNAQIFWTENFESGSTSGLVAGSYTGPNGAWTTTSTGTNGADFNPWYVSCAENGRTHGICGTGCVAVGPTATLATLHVGANSPLAGIDNGASYDAGGLCGIAACPETNQRAESPTINCTGKTGITLSFNYIENGDGTNDDASVWYYNGTTWALLVNTPKTPTTCMPQGTWQRYSIALPSSANNNPGVKIGFNWTNNDDGIGTDPSFAVDSVSLSATSSTSGPTASFTSVPTPATACTDSCITFTSTSTGSIDSIRWVLAVPGFPVLLSTVSPFKLCFPSAYMPAGTYTIRLRAYGSGVYDSSSAALTIKASPKPAISKTGKVLTVPGAYTGYQWSNSAGPIAGATTGTYTYTTGGTYTVSVDSGGCKGIASITVSTAGVYTLSNTGNNYWVSQPGGNSIVLHSEAELVQPLTVTIYDVTGRQLANEQWQAGRDLLQLSDLALTAGLYVVKLSGPDTSVVLKVMKQ